MACRACTTTTGAGSIGADADGARARKSCVRPETTACRPSMTRRGWIDDAGRSESCSRVTTPRWRWKMRSWDVEAEAGTKMTDGQAGVRRGAVDWTAVSSSLDDPRRVSTVERSDRMRAIGESVTESGACAVSSSPHVDDAQAR